MTTDESEVSQRPKWSDYPGLTEHMAARFAAAAALSDEELKANNLALLDNDSAPEAFAYLRDNSPERAAKQLGISVEDVEKMSGEEMVEQAKRQAETISPQEIREKIVKDQQHFAVILQKEKMVNQEKAQAEPDLA